MDDLGDYDGAPATVQDGQAPPERPPHWCEECERSFASARGLARHMDWKHRERTTGRPAKPEKPKTIAAPPISADLKQVTHELGEGIGAVGALVAAGLAWYKQTRVLASYSPEPIPVPVLGDLRRAPELESTFGHVIADKAPVTARVIMRYAEGNSTLLRWVVRFNAAMKGGEVGDLVLTHAAGAAHTLRPGSVFMAGAVASRAPGAFAEVMAENERLRVQIVELQQRMAAAGVARASDGRGSGD